MHTVHGYVLALYDANGGNACTWGLWSLTDINRGEPSTGFYGYKNTQGIISFAENENRTLKNGFPPVYWVTDYEYSHPAPANSSGWFLPSLGQCWYWMYNKAYLLSAVNKATGDNDYGWKLGYWSSSEDATIRFSTHTMPTPTSAPWIGIIRTVNIASVRVLLFD